MNRTISKAVVTLCVTVSLMLASYIAGIFNPPETANALTSGQTAAAATTPAPPARARWMKTPCKFDDGSPGNCYWNAQQQGDHLGHSFYRRDLPHRVCYFYVKPADARRWDGCSKATAKNGARS